MNDKFEKISYSIFKFKWFRIRNIINLQYRCNNNDKMKWIQSNRIVADDTRDDDVVQLKVSRWFHPLFLEEIVRFSFWVPRSRGIYPSIVHVTVQSLSLFLLRAGYFQRSIQPLAIYSQTAETKSHRMKIERNAHPKNKTGYIKFICQTRKKKEKPWRITIQRHLIIMEIIAKLAFKSI